jgi:hypothetical protein
MRAYMSDRTQRTQLDSGNAEREALAILAETEAMHITWGRNVDGVMYGHCAVLIFRPRGAGYTEAGKALAEAIATFVGDE